MGMYNYIDFECTCPVCHSKVKDFQSKDGELNRETLSPLHVNNFYAPCTKCGCWIDYYAKHNLARYVREVWTEGREVLREHTKTFKRSKFK